jgi:hypothetical protein
MRPYATDSAATVLAMLLLKASFNTALHQLFGMTLVLVDLDF